MFAVRVGMNAKQLPKFNNWFEPPDPSAPKKLVSTQEAEARAARVREAFKRPQKERREENGSL